MSRKYYCIFLQQILFMKFNKISFSNNLIGNFMGNINSSSEYEEEELDDTYFDTRDQFVAELQKAIDGVYRTFVKSFIKEGYTTKLKLNIQYPSAIFRL